MDVVMFDGDSEDEATENESYDIIHVTLGHFIGGADAEDGYEIERR